MNPNAKPFHMPRKTTYATVLGVQHTCAQIVAFCAPLAPIETLTDGQKVQQQVDALSSKITYQELLAMATSMAAAEFVLE
jgi:hypothetical protein